MTTKDNCLSVNDPGPLDPVRRDPSCLLLSKTINLLSSCCEIESETGDLTNSSTTRRTRVTTKERRVLQEQTGTLVLLL